jgi:superfamily II DNA or RNA helicase
MSEGLFPLRPVQAKALDMMRASVRGGKKRPQLQLPTAAGKTVIAAHMIASALEKGNRAAFTVPLISLVDQTIERFEQNGIDPEQIGVMQADHPLKRPHAPIQICSVQTLGKRENPKVEFVIVDESHLMYRSVLEWMEEDERKIFVGLSATPWAKGMAKYYDDLLIPATIRDMIKAGDLCDFRCFAPTKPDLKGIEMVADDYNQGQLSERMSQKQITADVVGTWLEKADRRPTMLFAVDRAHAGKLADEFRDAGVKTAYVDMNTTREERAAIRNLFHMKQIEVICSVGTMTHGVDMDVRCISFVRPTKSEILYVQAIGRGLRKAEGKDHLLILDHSNATLELGLVTEIGRTELRGGKPAEGSEEKKPPELPRPRECPRCGEIVPATATMCRCGYEFKRASKVRTVNGELYEVGKEPTVKVGDKQWTRAERRAFYAELRWYGADKLHNQKWPTASYRNRFGEWPPWAWNDDAPRAPTWPTLMWIKSRKIAFAKGKEAHGQRR